MTNPAVVSVGGNFTFWVHLSDTFERIIDTTFLGSQFRSKRTQLTDLYQLSSPDSLLDKSMTFFHSDFLSCVKSRKTFTCRKFSLPLSIFLHPSGLWRWPQMNFVLVLYTTDKYHFHKRLITLKNKQQTVSGASLIPLQ